jgi:hypothetical protein
MTESVKLMYVSINGVKLEFAVEGETLKGEDKVLLHEDTNLLDKTGFNDVGFQIIDLLDESEFQNLRTGFTKLVVEWLQEYGVHLPEDFDLLYYHRYVDDAAHTHVVKKIQNGVDIALFPISNELLEKRIEAITGYDVESRCAELNHHTFSIRIVRPSQLTDNNPPHRDVWLNHLRNAVNIYLPVCGSDENSALPILPGSHCWKESEIERTAAGAVINNVRYNVPCVVGSSYGLAMIRPNPGTTQAMLFSPYLIHGGGYNLNTDTTRVSLEMRFWKK